MGVPWTFDVTHAEAGKRQYGRRGKRSCEEEYSLIGEEVSAYAHHRSGKAIADGSETGIAAEPRPQRGVADQPQADRSDDRPEHAARACMQHTGCHDHEERGPD